MNRDILRLIAGRRLTSAGGTFHVYRGRVSEVPMALWLGFDGAKPFRLAGASDGWGMIIDELAPKEVDMQKSGSISFVRLEESSMFSRASGRVVRQILMVTSPSPSDVIGVRLDFDACTIRILNWGDQLFVGTAFPCDADLREIRELTVA
jgi:hypothetical protein